MLNIKSGQMLNVKSGNIVQVWSLIRKHQVRTKQTTLYYHSVLDKIIVKDLKRAILSSY